MLHRLKINNGNSNNCKLCEKCSDCSCISFPPILSTNLLLSHTFRHSLLPPHSGGNVKSQNAKPVEMRYSKIGIIEPKLYIVCHDPWATSTCTYVRLCCEKDQNGNSCKIWLIVVFGGF